MSSHTCSAKPSSSTRSNAGWARLWVALLALALTGCAHVARPSTPPSRHTLRLLARAPEQCLVRIDDALAYKVGYDGLVRFEVPSLPPGQATYLFGFIKVSDHRPEEARVVQVLRGGQVVRRLSLQQIAQLPLDSDGARLLRL